MALVSCLECGNPVSEDAEACPRCGRPPNSGPIVGYAHAPALADIGQRVMARAIDIAVVGLTTALLALILAWMATVGSATVISVFVVVWVVYFTVLEAGGGRTPGKAAAGLAVTANDHVTPIAPLDAFVRNVVLVIPLLWLVALAGMSIDGVRRQGFHDKLVGTVVVYTG